MEKEQVVLEQQPNDSQVNDNTDYIEEIKKLRANSVSKDDYNKLVEEKKKLVKALANGEYTNDEQTPTIDYSKRNQEIVKKLFTDNLTDIEAFKLIDELHDNVKEETGRDIYVANNSQYSAGPDSYAAAQETDQMIKSVLERADGDDQVFHAELARSLNDIPIPRR